MHNYLKELHYIVAITNVPSILDKGILSKDKASHISHVSVANKEVQKRRDDKKVPKGSTLHSYVNLYINARNPMLFFLMDHSEKDLCILKIDSNVIKIDGVVITDRNASSDYANFYSPSECMDKLNFDMIEARYWKHPEDLNEEWKHKSIMCAEILIPKFIPPEYILGAYVSCPESKDEMLRLGFNKDITINPDMFFNRKIRRSN